MKVTERLPLNNTNFQWLLHNDTTHLHCFYFFGIEWPRIKWPWVSKEQLPMCSANKSAFSLSTVWRSRWKSYGALQCRHLPNQHHCSLEKEKKKYKYYTNNTSSFLKDSVNTIRQLWNQLLPWVYVLILLSPTYNSQSEKCPGGSTTSLLEQRGAIHTCHPGQ